MKWSLIIPFGIAIVVFIIYLAVRNLKDEKIFTKELNNDYPKIKEKDV